MVQAESYENRDLLCHRMASHCCKLAQMLMKKDKDFKGAAKWMNLSLRYLKSSLNPKKEAEEMKITAELDKLEKQIEEIRRMKQERQDPAT
jgi:hypothetical protein